ncbi:uncharacterized protein LOC135945075 [Cloeon dipterum]|uniref:uncharacterized protein LOC135945075 n=1 Tax=Cloeon dipterum TaxID=197152 RepID=UPI0032205B8A
MYRSSIVYQAQEEFHLVDLDETVFSGDVVLSKVQESQPNVFVAHLDDDGPRFNSTCGLYVNPLEIHYNNIYWQMQKSGNESYYLYGAYFDDRPKAVGRIIRIIGMIDQYQTSVNAFCLMWFGNDTPAISRVLHSQFMWYEEWGYMNQALFPYVFSCEIPTEYENRVPDSVSFVGHPCDRATNNLKLVYNPSSKEDKKDFFVCVKGLNFAHNAKIAIRLVEWIELLKILGADKIVFYELQVHENITRILENYKHTRNVELIKTSLPGHYANMPHFMSTYLKKHIGVQMFQELIQYNDCFYRNMYKYRYVILLDVDEVIVPRGDLISWQQLVYDITLPKAVAKENITYASLIARNVHFMDEKKELQDWYPDIPEYMHMLQNVRRNKEHRAPTNGIKAFHNSELILSLHNHYARACIGDVNLWCPEFDFDLEDAHLQHYCYGRGKSECTTKNDEDLAVDTNIWKYRTELIREVNKVLKSTGFLKKQRKN